jgi:hypothetical protein
MIPVSLFVVFHQKAGISYQKNIRVNIDERHRAFYRTHLSAMAQLENRPRAIHLEIVDGDMPSS